MRRLPILSPVAETSAYAVRVPLPPKRLTSSDSPETPLTREQRRSRRAHDVRATTISMKRLTKRRQELNAFAYANDVRALGGAHPPLPKTRSECPPADAPCGFVSCKWHLAYDVSPRTGSIKANFPDLDIDEMPETCALRVADRGGATLEEVGRIANLTRERVRQLEVKAFRKMFGAAIRECLDEEPIDDRGPILDRRGEAVAREAEAHDWLGGYELYGCPETRGGE